MAGEEQGLEISCTSVTEQALVQRLQAGDAEAFDTLFRRYVAEEMQSRVQAFLCQKLTGGV